MLVSHSLQKPRIAFAAVTATLTWVGLALELSGFIQRALMQQQSALHGIWMFLFYFTNISNLFAAITLSVWLKHAISSEGGHPTYLDVTGVLAYVWLAGIVYNLMLRSFMHANWAASILLHDVVPLLFLAFWWIAIPRLRFHVKQVLSWLLFPLVYFIYALVRGQLAGRYPYPFLDVSRFGYEAIFRNALGITIALLVLCMLLVGLNSLKQE